MKKIPILMAADDNYVRYLWVAILSILKNKYESTSYDFYILSPRPYAKSVSNEFYELAKRYEGTTLNFIQVKSLFCSKDKQILPEATYYYLKIADIIKEYDKAIYLDPDIIVLNDLTELFEIDLGDNYVAGVKAAGYVKDTKYAKAIDLKDISQYINANSLVFNLKKIREDNLTSKFIIYSQNNYPSMDQDVLNVVCYNHILHIPFKYNVMTKYLPVKNNRRYNYNLLKEVYGETNLNEAEKGPIVIHYANVGEKPWNMRIIKDSYWWKYARLSPWRGYLILSFIKNYILRYLNKVMKSCFHIKKFYNGNQRIKQYNLLGFTIVQTKKRKK